MTHRRLASVASALLATAAAGASERLFTYSQESSVLAPGQQELELWGTWRQGRKYYYRALDERAEFEFGITERLQASVYLNFKSETQADHDALGNQTTPTTLTHESGVDGMSLEAKYKLSDPVADAVGSALYVEVTGSSEEYEVELKGIADKRVGAETVAANLTWEYERANDPTTTHPDHEIEATLAWTHQLAQRLFAGLEAVWASEYEFTGATQDLANSALFLGPVIHWRGPENLWATLTALPQVHAFHTEPGNTGHQELIGRERFQVRLIVGTHF